MGPCWTNEHAIIHCDNEAAVHIINKSTSANPIVMRYLRNLFWLSAIYNFRFTAIYISGKQKGIADSESCLHQPTKCLAFYEHLCLQSLQQVMGGVFYQIICLLTAGNSSVADCLDPEMVKQLEAETATSASGSV